MSRRLFVFIFLLLTCGACAPISTAISSATPAAVDKGADEARGRALAFYDDWEKTIASKDHKALEALHAPGVPQWVSPWGKDALKLVRVSSWLDAGSALPEGRCGIQVWDQSSDGASLHQLQITCGAEEAKIVYSRTLHASLAAPAKAVGTRRASVWAPTSTEDAGALWRRLDPTGADLVDVLAQLPEHRAVSGPLAKAVIEGQNFYCAEVELQETCGDSYEEWRPLSAGAGFESPCLQRHLAMWALAPGLLSAEDVVELRPQLMKIARRSRELDADLTLALLDGITHLSDDIRLPFIDAAPSWLGARSLSGLSQASLRRLFRDHGWSTALLAMSVTPDNSAVLRAAVFSEDIDAPTRREILSRLNQAKDADAAFLVQVAQERECGLAMSAASFLAARGDDRFLPRPPITMAIEPHLRALCMGSSDIDAGRRLSLWRSYLTAENIEVGGFDGRSLTKKTKLDASDLPGAFYAWSVSKVKPAKAAKTVERYRVDFSSESYDYEVTFGPTEEGWEILSIQRDYINECGC